MIGIYKSAVKSEAGAPVYHSISAFTALAELCIVSALRVTTPVRLTDSALRLVHDTADASKQRKRWTHLLGYHMMRTRRVLF